MKINLHTHTTFCDGRNTPTEMVEAAIIRGFNVLGFSSHIDMLKDVDAYIAEINRLKDIYRGRIEIRCGIESEGTMGLELRDRLDYIIGSFHYVDIDGERVCIDGEPHVMSEKEIRAYFAYERELVKEDFTFLAHPDLVRKFDSKFHYIDSNAEWYLEELTKTADAIAASGKLVEINTGAISRGWTQEAYPFPDLRAMLKERGVKFILSSDAHAAENLDTAFERYEHEAK